MSDVNQNSSLLDDFYDDISAIGSFFTQETPAKKADFIKNNYQTFDLNQLNDAVKQMNSGALQYNVNHDEILRNLQARIANLTSNNIVPSANTSNDTVSNNTPESVVSPTFASTANQFAPVITDATKYDLSTEKQKK